MKQVAILAGGPQNLVPPFDSDQLKDCEWVGVDRGLYYLLKAGIRPIRAFGDFDSISKAERRWIDQEHIELTVYPAEKDFTDMEIAVNWVIEQQPEHCYLLGATGGRMDHGLLNIQLLYKGLQAGVNFKILDKQNEITLLKPGSYHVSKQNEFPYISFVPFSKKITGIHLKGFKYPLENAELHLGSSLCISNELIEPKGTVAFDNGLLLMIKSCDRDIQKIG
ncbi:thiamine pyrophosphokinase [Scopulibacillus daqui]|uniref:Thiamine diphosphokinase n=1 Tax=Scopulibacillus daqui TaxID=1469162 RepID=A0ABS2PWC6_9BACL|nr:thiamine diphosphokinase [Scopulibacillus daqui]MBM7644315.1 thiamine pyrophosphokinase [Scopulibacillus daqui]